MSKTKTISLKSRNEAMQPYPLLFKKGKENYSLLLEGDVICQYPLKSLVSSTPDFSKRSTVELLNMALCRNTRLRKHPDFMACYGMVKYASYSEFL